MNHRDTLAMAGHTTGCLQRFCVDESHMYPVRNVFPGEYKVNRCLIYGLVLKVSNWTCSGMQGRNNITLLAEE